MFINTTEISIFAIFFFYFRDDNIEYIIHKDKIYHFLLNLEEMDLFKFKSWLLFLRNNHWSIIKRKGSEKICHLWLPVTREPPDRTGLVLTSSIHSFTNISKTDMGTAPLVRISEWKSRMSKPVPTRKRDTEYSVFLSWCLN